MRETDEIFNIIETGDLNQIKIMFNSGKITNPNISDESLHNCIFIAVTKIQNDLNCLDIIKFLTQKGVNPTIKDINNETVLYYTAAVGHLRCTEWLLNSYTFDKSQTNYKGETPLFYAVKFNRFELVNLFILYGYNVNHVNSDGNSCIFNIISNEQWKIAKLLVSSGLDDKMKGKYKVPYKIIAEKLGLFKIVDVLRNKEEYDNDNDIEEEEDSNSMICILFYKKESGNILTFRDIQAIKKELPEIFDILEPNNCKENLSRNLGLEPNMNNEIEEKNKMDINQNDMLRPFNNYNGKKMSYSNFKGEEAFWDINNL